MEPMTAVLTDERFSDPGWIFERKLDGIRCLAFKAEQRVRLRSRNDLSLNGRFPEIVAALEQDPVTDVVLDGEIVTEEPLRARKALLRRSLGFADPIRMTAHRNRDGEAFFAEACRKGWEGLIAKRADAPYTHGRSR